MARKDMDISHLLRDLNSREQDLLTLRCQIEEQQKLVRVLKFDREAYAVNLQLVRDKLQTAEKHLVDTEVACRQAEEDLRKSGTAHPACPACHSFKAGGKHTPSCKIGWVLGFTAQDKEPS